MNPPEFKFVTTLIKGVRIKKLHGVLTTDGNISIIDPGSTSRQTVTPLCNRSL